MSDAVNLPLKQKLKLFRQSVYAAISFRGHVPVEVRPHPLGAAIKVEGKTIFAPSPLRWKLYKKGWAARIDRLKQEYGIERYASLTPQSIVVDIGANAGEFAHLAVQYGARIYCLEPDPKVFSCLKENTSGLANVSIHDVLIMDANTEVDFYLAPATADSSVFDEGQGQKLSKHAVTLERFCDEHNIQHIDLLKCDAEGAEPEVLEGAKSIFSKIRTVAIDTGAERQGKRTNIECRKILETAGFEVIDKAIGKRLMTFGINRSMS